MPTTAQTKRGSLKRQKQAETIVLSAKGFTQRQIAAQLGMSPATVNRAIADNKEVVAAIEETFQKRLVEEIGKNIDVERMGVKYAKLALEAKNEAVALATLNQIGDLNGVVTERERMRINRATEAPNTQPLFAFNGNVSVNVTVHQPQDVVKGAINVTPENGETA